MTNQETRRTLDALVETKKHLAREVAYQPHLQNLPSISFYRSHIEKLEKMLSDSWEAAVMMSKARA